MTRGELYRVFRPSRDDPRRSRVFVIVSRPAFIQSSSSTVICAPIYSSYHGLESQVLVGIDEGLKQQSAIHCDALVSLPKSTLTHYLGSLSSAKMSRLNHALAVAYVVVDFEPHLRYNHPGDDRQLGFKPYSLMTTPRQEDCKL